MNHRLVTFQGTLSDADVKRHLEFTFTCPPGTQRLELKLTFTPAAVDGVRNMLCLSVISPGGFRGSGHRHGTEHCVELGETFATPGYFPGVLEAGVWRVFIHTQMIMPGHPLTYHLEVVQTDTPKVQLAPPLEFTPPERGPGWYKGDLHAHSVHSDAAWSSRELVASAARFGLDFVTLSDHNTVSGLPEMDALATPELLTMGGFELTTFYGHALALGRRDWLDWLHTPMTELARRADVDELFIIAHPRREGDPVCTGCRWEYAELMPGTAQVVEIWNSGSWDAHNEEALALWYGWLNEGHRVTSSAGTDAHRAAPEGAQIGFNVVYAETLTEKAILAAVRQGRSYLSSGPVLELTLPNASEPITGSVIAAVTPLSLRYAAVPEATTLRFMADGAVYQDMNLAGSGQLELRLPGSAHWGVLELRAADGKLLTVTNPVFTPKFAASTSATPARP